MKSEKSSGLQALLDEARGDVPSAERLGRVRARVEEALGTSIAPARGDAPPSVPRRAAPASSSPVAFGVGIAGMVLIALWLLVSPEGAGSREGAGSPEHVVSPVASPAVVPVEAVRDHSDVREPPPVAPLPGDLAPTLEVEQVAPAARAPREIAAREAPDEAHAADPALAGDPGLPLDPGSTLREEIALLEQAIAARERGDLASARALLAGHRTRFPDGVLSPERERLLGELSAPAVAPGPAAPDPAPTP